MKYIWKQPISGTGSYTVQGTPRTIGVDLDGSLCVWFEAEDQLDDQHNERPFP